MKTLPNVLSTPISPCPVHHYVLWMPLVSRENRGMTLPVTFWKEMLGCSSPNRARAQRGTDTPLGVIMSNMVPGR